MKTWQQCCDYFGVNVDRGLSTSEVKKNLDKYGPNGKSTKIVKKSVKIFHFYEIFLQIVQNSLLLKSH